MIDIKPNLNKCSRWFDYNFEYGVCSSPIDFFLISYEYDWIDRAEKVKTMPRCTVTIEKFEVDSKFRNIKHEIKFIIRFSKMTVVDKC